MKIPKRVKELLLLMLLVLLFRFLFLDFFFYLEQQLGFPLFGVWRDVLVNFPLLFLTGICSYYVFKYLNNRWIRRAHPIVGYSVLVLYLLLMSFASGYYISLNEVSASTFGMAWLIVSSLIVLIINLFVIVFLKVQWDYSRSQSEELELQRQKTVRAQHDLNKLKVRLNPHFLFNSLNVLNSLVFVDPQRASLFIQKMAKVYRYLLTQEEQETVTLSDEMTYAVAYFDMLKERFPEGVELDVRLPDSLHKSRVVPCAIQIQIENAVKHNVIDPDRKLLIEIYSEGEWIIIRNNLIPKIKAPESTGIGLASIEAQYSIVLKRPIVVSHDRTHFWVKLPLLLDR